MIFRPSGIMGDREIDASGFFVRAMNNREKE